MKSSSSTYIPRCQRPQQGAVLIVSLLILIVMTLIGVASMQTTTLQERMAGNLRDLDLAFQAAETGLRDGEALLNLAVVPPFNNSNGLYQPAAAGANPRWQTVAWTDATQVRVYDTTAIDGLADQPRHIIEELPIDCSGGSLEAGTALERCYYRITARASGGTSNAVVMLQSTFKR